MIYSFARVGAVLRMKVGDYFVQGRRGHVRLHEKGGKEHEVPCHHNLEQYLDAYLAAAGIGGNLDGPGLFGQSHRLRNLGDRNEGAGRPGRPAEMGEAATVVCGRYGTRGPAGLQGIVCAARGL